MSLINQLFRQIIGKDLPSDLNDIFLTLLLVPSSPDKRLLEDIKMLWYQPGHIRMGDGLIQHLFYGSILECLAYPVTTSAEEYANNYDSCQIERRRFKPLVSIEEKLNIKEEIKRFMDEGYDIKEATRLAQEYHRSLSAIDVINIIRMARDGKLFTIRSGTSGMDFTSLTIYKTRYKENYKHDSDESCPEWSQDINRFFDMYMYRSQAPSFICNNSGFIWLQSREPDIYGKLMLKPDIWMNNNFFNGDQPRYDLDY